MPLFDVPQVSRSRVRDDRGAPRSSFRWVAGEDALKGYTADNGTTRTFCRHCGSSLMFSSPSARQDVVETALGTLDDDVPVEPSAHIFVGSAAHWTVLGDDLPKYAEVRGSARVPSASRPWSSARERA